MFRSQLIKRYELPYCTLEIVSDRRFCLWIENLDPDNQSCIKLSSDRAQLQELTQQLDQQFPSLTPPATSQQASDPLYPAALPQEDQWITTTLSWRQLCDLNKILHRYQTDLANNTLVQVPHQRRWRVVASVLALLILGGIGMRWQQQTSQSSNDPAAKATESLLPNPAVPSASTTEINPSSSPSQAPNPGNLRLSDSLKTLDRLPPPNSVKAPASPDFKIDPSLTPPEKKRQSLPQRSSPPPKTDQPSLKVPDFPSLNSPPPQANGNSRSQPETLFDRTPQVAEVRQYFQSQWQPPKQLAQDLEYQVIINANGSLQRIVPLGNAAETHLSALPSPPKQQPFVSSSPAGGDQTMRLVLRPNGKVNAFPIASNQQ